MTRKPGPQLDFDANERRRNAENLADVAQEIAERSDRLRTRILHFSGQFGIAEDDFWRDLDANPSGPLAAVLAREARRQNIHEHAAAEFIEALADVSDFRKLPASGNNAVYINRDGQILSGRQFAGAARPSKSLDFQWATAGVTCYAAQKYTKAGGGNQDSQFNEMELLLRSFQGRVYNGVALFVLVDGAYYNSQRLTRLRNLTRLQSPRSYVTSVNDLHEILRGIVRSSSSAMP